MFSRSFLVLSSRQSFKRVPRKITSQVPSHLSSRRGFSAASQKNAPQESTSSLSKFLIGSVAVGAAALAAYQAGYLDPYILKEQRDSSKSDKISAKDKDSQAREPLQEQTLETKIDESNISTHSAETHSDLPHLEELRESQPEIEVKDESHTTSEEDRIPVNNQEFSDSSHNIVTSEDLSNDSKSVSEEIIDVKSPEAKTNTELNVDVETEPITQSTTTVPEENEATAQPFGADAEDLLEDAPGNGVKELSSSLGDVYHLENKPEETAPAFSSEQSTDTMKHFSNEKKPKNSGFVELKASAGTNEDLGDVSKSKDGKLVFDFLEAIHAAEKRQAELDAHVFAVEKRAMKEKYEKELKDAKVRELMYVEKEAILEKELNKEKVKAAAALKSLQEKAEAKLMLELELKESEAESKLKKVQELAKAELAAAIASEKASQIEKLAESNLHINALCMAFYARSEEAHQTHSVHKLALGALALEDALSKGLPIQTEIVALHTYLEGIDKDSLFDLVLSSLPEETRKHGTDTVLQLNQKFDNLKGNLRHFSLIPPGGGGILSHSLAHIASRLKVREAGESGDGIEAVINRVETLLADGKLAEAAEALEEGVKGSQAAEVVTDWVTKARNRAIAEQALTLLQSYATSISLA